MDIRVARSGHAGRDSVDRGRQGLISPLDRRDHVQVRTVNVDSHGMEARNWAAVDKSRMDGRGLLQLHIAGNQGRDTGIGTGVGTGTGSGRDECN